MNENNQANLQANNQSNQTQQAKVKTVINGQEVDVKAAQAAQEAFEKQNNQTGIQAHHDNSTEAVNAGEMAQQSMNQAQPTETIRPIKQADLQSGQQHLASHIQEAQQALQKVESEMQQQEQQRMQQAQQVQQQMAQKTQGLSEDQKVKVEDHQTIQADLDAKAKAKANKKG